MIRSNPNLNSDHIGFRKTANQALIHAAEKELHSFIMDTLKLFVTKTENRWAASSCMRQFVRVDISFMEKDGRMSYFVNEIERGLDVGLWAANDDGPRRVGLVASTFAPSLHRWLTSRLEHTM